MASIKERKRKSGSVYLAEIRLRGHLPVSKTFRRKNEAKRWASQAEAEILSGRGLSNGIKNHRTLADAIDRYLQEPLPGSEKTVSEYAWMLRFWKERLGHLNLSEITPARIYACRESLLKEPSHAKKTKDPHKLNDPIDRSFCLFRASLSGN